MFTSGHTIRLKSTKTGPECSPVIGQYASAQILSLLQRRRAVLNLYIQHSDHSDITLLIVVSPD
jgi:hypothetical protein